MPRIDFPGQLGGRLSRSPCVFYCYPPSIPSHTPSRQIGRRSCVRFHPNRHQIPESVCHLELIASQFAVVVRGHKPFGGPTAPNRARVLLNQNPFQERAAGKWCKGRLPRNFSRSTRATSGGTRAIGGRQYMPSARRLACSVSEMETGL